MNRPPKPQEGDAVAASAPPKLSNGDQTEAISSVAGESTTPPQWNQTANITPGSADDPSAKTMALEPPAAFDPSTTTALGNSSTDIGSDNEFTISDEGVAAQNAAPPGFDILGTLGRGGMGVVYDARQRSLKRRVALKMVTAGVHASPEHLARFQIEAEAVASLQHPNIVQIYEVGEHRGIPFFALELVDGGSLMDRIADHPLSSRKAAELVKQLADAMHYAHQRGIVHRDLKPGNVLMTRSGVPKITDFGLAKRIDGSASSQTEAGSVLGTPSYMAPEQAKGAVAEVGPLADVYSLGAVLYHLLTGRPPFIGATLLETLEQVRSQEPVSVRQLQPKVQRDLETIALKCLQKEPRKRYADAEALRRDLDHFLAGEPIEARPVSQFGRLWRWCRRNPGIASLTAAVFSLLAIVAVTSSVLLIRIAAEKEKTELARQEAVKAKLLAEQNEELAAEQGRLAVNTFHNVVVKIQQQLRLQPGNQKLREQLLADAFAGLEKVVESAADTPLMRRTRAAAYQHLGDLASERGRTDAALKHYKKCQTIVEAMAADQPNNAVTKYNLSVIYDKLGELYKELLADCALARDYFNKCLKLRTELADEKPKDSEFATVNLKEKLGNCLNRLSTLSLTLGNPDEAWRQLQQYIEKRSGKKYASPKDALAAAEGTARPSFSVGMALRLGDLSFHLNDVPTARGWLDWAVQTSRTGLARDPSNSTAQQVLAASLEALGDLELKLSQPANALKLYSEAHHLRRKLLDLEPEASGPRNHLAFSDYRMGTACWKLGQLAEAKQFYEECLKLRHAIVKDDPSNSYRQIDLMLIAARCGQVEEATAAADKLWKRAPKDAANLMYVASAYGLCAAQSNGDPAQKSRFERLALEALGQAIAEGYRDTANLQSDPDLEPLRELEGFRKLLSKLASAN